MSARVDVVVGVLALQGASAAQVAAFARLGVAAREVRSAAELDGLTHLVLPGGESTTLHHLMRLFGLLEPIAARARAGELALFGTCAGAILLARDAGGRPPTLGLLDAAIERNAYGRQIDSFERALEPGVPALRGVFIRAPRFTAVGPEVRVLAHLDGAPIALEADGVLATTFHPELAEETWFHRRFLAMRPRAPLAAPLAPG
jgi:5'-phosphate synthase pdxT subunit